MDEEKKIKRLKRKGIEDSRGYWPHIIVKLHDDIKIPDEIPYEDGVEKYLKKDRIACDQLIKKFPGLTLRTLYTKPEHIDSVVKIVKEKDPKYTPSNMLTYFVVDCPIGVHPEVLVKAFQDWPSVQTAYHYSPGSDTQVNPGGNPFFGQQGYLDPAPAGIDAKFAWQFNNKGDGTGMNVIDLEKGWILDHEDLNSHPTRRPPELLHGDPKSSSRHHGTAVLGIISAVNNTLGCVGIAHNVDSVNVVSHHHSLRHVAMHEAMLKLGRGDVLLLEVQVTTKKWHLMPVEVNKDEFDKIESATHSGIVVVEAAGNGGYNLDNFANEAGDQILNRWSPDFKDSGAIMVGAASSADPHTRVRNKMGRLVTNFGSRVDCYAWGENVVTCGYGDLDEGMGDDRKKYTSTFSYTSSASAIITGAALIVQAVAKARRGEPFSPRKLRDILSDPDNGTPSKNGKDVDRIGLMPDLRKILPKI